MPTIIHNVFAVREMTRRGTMLFIMIANLTHLMILNIFRSEMSSVYNDVRHIDRASNKCLVYKLTLLTKS